LEHSVEQHAVSVSQDLHFDFHQVSKYWIPGIDCGYILPQWQVILK